jgi:lipopolysaccharide assembly outer membrane protein LptD (OstA)
MRPERLLLLLLALVTAAEMARAAPAPARTGPREIEIAAERMDYDQNKKLVRLIGKVKITSEEGVMTAPYAEYHTDTMIGEFQGGVKITQPGSTLVGNRMVVKYRENQVVLKGNVRLVTTRAPGPDKTPSGLPTTLVCDELEYNLLTEEGEARGSVRVRQGERRAFSDRARYSRPKQVVVMEGNVRFERGQGDWLSSDRATMNMATNIVEAEGQVFGKFQVERPAPATGASPRPSGPPAPVPLAPEVPLQPSLPAPAAPLPGVE